MAATSLRFVIGRVCRTAHRLLSSGVVLLAVQGLGVAAAQERTELEALFEERRELELKIHKLLRVLPQSIDVDREERMVRRFGTEAGLGELRVELVAGGERVKLENGRPAPVELHRLEISGRGDYRRVQAFLSYMGNLGSPGAFERLHLVADAGETVRF